MRDELVRLYRFTSGDGSEILVTGESRQLARHSASAQLGIELSGGEEVNKCTCGGPTGWARRVGRFAVCNTCGGRYDD